MQKKVLLASAIALLAITQSAFADWPARTIKLVVPYPAGGSVDMIARHYAEHLGKTLGQAVMIENKGGAGTNIGTSYVSKAKPDGYTILLATESMANNAVLGPAPGFNVVDGIAPVSLLTTIPSLVAAHPDFEASNVQELATISSADPLKHTIGSASLNLQISRIQQATGIELTHATYKGGAQASTDAMGKQVNMVLASIPVLQPLIASGKLKGLGITGEQRSKALPNIPTFKEQGYDKATFSVWYGVFAPVGTPKNVIEKLNSATRQFVSDVQVIERLEGQGYELVASTPDALRQQVKQDIAVAQKFSSMLIASSH